MQMRTANPDSNYNKYIFKLYYASRAVAIFLMNYFRFRVLSNEKDTSYIPAPAPNIRRVVNGFAGSSPPLVPRCGRPDRPPTPRFVHSGAAVPTDRFAC